MAGSNLFGGSYLGTVGAGAYGSGPFGAGALGIGSPAQVASGRPNTTSLGLTAGIGETDNILLTSGSKESETLALAGLSVALNRHAPQLDASAVGSFQDLYYLQNAFGNDLTGSFSGDADVGLVPDRFYWVVDENFGQNQLSPVAPTIPTNLQNVNVVSTGPDLILHPGGPSNFVELGARYARSDYQTSEFGGYDGVGLFAAGHQLSQVSALALHVTYQRMYFNNTVINQDYTLRKAYGSYTAKGARTALEFEAGAAQVDDRPFRSSTSWITRPIAQLRLTRALTPAMSISLQAGRQVTDPADSFATLQSGASGAIVIAPVYGTTSSYVSTYGAATWTFALNRTSIGATASWQRSSYDSSQLLDTKITNYGLTVGRRLTPRLTAQLSGTLAKSDYYESQFENEQRTVQFSLQWALAPKLVASLIYTHTSQGTSGVVQALTRSGYFNLFNLSSVYVSDAYSANTGFLTLTYVPISE